MIKLDLDARNVLKELEKMYEEDTSAGDMETILVDYLEDRGYIVLEPFTDAWMINKGEEV